MNAICEDLDSLCKRICGALMASVELQAERSTYFQCQGQHKTVAEKWNLLLCGYAMHKFVPMKAT